MHALIPHNLIWWPWGDSSPGVEWLRTLSGVTPPSDNNFCETVFEKEKKNMTKMKLYVLDIEEALFIR